ncbi:MAG: hypothetical protein MJZ37_06450 [Bacilli bacterium]|nr:hypothetical protein [Bacilli bacterium]
MNEENLVLEDTENADELTAEETVEEVVDTTPEKIYTEDELNARVDELLSKKIARREAKIRKELEREYRPYKELGTVVNAGLGTDSIQDATSNLRDFYSKKGIEIPSQPTYSDYDIKVLAQDEANNIIDMGFDEVVEEVDRLADIGVDNMTPRERQVFSVLAEYRTSEEKRKELASVGVSADVYESKEFKDFAAQFNQNTPISNIYKLYSTSANAIKPEKIGSMKNGNTQEEKDFFTPEEVDKLTAEDYDNPQIFEKVRRSMAKW